ncbi:hypothetical protein [Deinococcus aquiradiocola]|uniref:Lipoprotein n=1 Tax=Deinococcus aquiradiocola TaxID=393059 RepID=A0A917PGG5_9DEIO|nr:hypothetical protein [Deinococcus aquiradiocola]GGJ76461.1 hypothetical protein GCM10008939_20820 [Deinococcus aquiradiocola]
MNKRFFLLPIIGMLGAVSCAPLIVGLPAQRPVFEEGQGWQLTTPQGLKISLRVPPRDPLIPTYTTQLGQASVHNTSADFVIYYEPASSIPEFFSVVVGPDANGHVYNCDFREVNAVTVGSGMQGMYSDDTSEQSDAFVQYLEEGSVRTHQYCSMTRVD